MGSKSDLSCQAFSIDLRLCSFRSSGFTLPSGSVTQVYGLGSERVSEFLFLLAGLQNLRGTTKPAARGRLVRTQDLISLEDLSFVKLGEEPLYAISPAQRANMIGFIFENPELFTVGRTVLEDFQYSFAAMGQPPPQPQLLRRYGLFDKQSRQTEVLSGGEQHRLNCASVFELQQGVVFADFSYSNLDLEFMGKVAEWLLELKDRGSLVVVHGLSDLRDASCVDLALVVEGGEVKESPPDKAKFPTHAEERHRLEAELLPRTVGPTILNVKRVGRADRITSSVSFKVRGGEIIQIWGPNGCGKTSLAKILAGAVTEHTGSIEADDGVAPRLCLQFPERLFLESQVFKEVGDPRLLELIGLSEQEWGLHPRNLNRSQQKLLGCLLTFVYSGKLVILDEPTSGLDFPAKLRFVQLLNHYKEHAVLIITHDPALQGLGSTLRWEAIVA